MLISACVVWIPLALSPQCFSDMWLVDGRMIFLVCHVYLLQTDFSPGKAGPVLSLPDTQISVIQCQRDLRYLLWQLCKLDVTNTHTHTHAPWYSLTQSFESPDAVCEHEDDSYRCVWFPYRTIMHGPKVVLPCSFSNCQERNESCCCLHCLM